MATFPTIGMLAKEVHAGGSLPVATGGSITLTSTDGIIKTDTVDGADNKSISIDSYGGSFPTDASRGASIWMTGNEYPGSAGEIWIVAGSNGGVLQFLTSAGYPDLRIANGTADGTDTGRLRINSGGGTSVARGGGIYAFGNEFADATQAGNAMLEAGYPGRVYLTSDHGVILRGINTTSLFIEAETLDGGDSKAIHIAANAGEVTSATRSGYVSVHGNEHATSPGMVVIGAGDAAGSAIQMQGVMRLPVTAAPASPADGDMWRQDNTNTGLKVRIGGVTKTVTVA